MDTKVVVTFKDDVALNNGRPTDTTKILDELKHRGIVESYDVAIRRETAPKDSTIEAYKKALESRPDLSEEDKKLLDTLRDIKARAVASVVAEKDAEIAKISVELDECHQTINSTKQNHEEEARLLKEFVENHFKN